MRGRVTSFFDDRTYGFITPLLGAAHSVFFNLAEAEADYSRPRRGDLVEFEPGPVHHDRVRALSVRLLQRPIR
jgi:cold shock CspA family protein